MLSLDACNFLHFDLAMPSQSIYPPTMTRFTRKAKTLAELFSNLNPRPLEWVWFRPPGAQFSRRYEVIGHYGNTVSGKAAVKIRSETGIEWTVSESECVPCSANVTPPASTEARQQKRWEASGRILSALKDGPATLRGLASRLRTTPAHLLQAIATLTLTDLSVIGDRVRFPAGSVPPGEKAPVSQEKTLLVYRLNTEEP